MCARALTRTQSPGCDGSAAVLVTQVGSSDRSEPTAIALRPFIPWLADCLTETEKHYTEETDPAAPAALRDKSGVGKHPHHPKMVPAPHVRIVVDLMSETLLNREAFEQSVANRAGA